MCVQIAHNFSEHKAYICHPPLEFSRTPSCNKLLSQMQKTFNFQRTFLQFHPPHPKNTKPVASKVRKNVFQFVLPFKASSNGNFALLLACHIKTEKSECNKIFFLSFTCSPLHFFLTRSLVVKLFHKFSFPSLFPSRYYFCVQRKRKQW